MKKEKYLEIKAKEITSKVIYRNGNSLGDQYAPNNCIPYGTKWRIRLKKEYHSGGYTWKIIGSPELLDANWEIDEEKIEASNDFFHIYDL